MSESLFYQEKENTLFLKADGHLTAGLCADLREKVFARFDAAPPVKAMYVDLSQCSYMDSTFMGLLVGFNKRLMKLGAPKLGIVKPTPTAKDLLSGLGLGSLVEFIEVEIPFPHQMIDIIKTQNTGADILLKAHENLMELSEENQKRFQTLHAVLKNQQKEE